MFYKVILDSPITGRMRFIDTKNNLYNVHRNQYRFLRLNDVFEGHVEPNHIKVDLLLTDDDDMVKFKPLVPFKHKEYPMQKFNSIESFRHVVANTRRWSDFHKLPLPVVRFKGTVKLHGSNGGVQVLPHKIVAQSRTQELVDGLDNAGFAQFIAKPNVSRALRILSHYLHYTINPLKDGEETNETDPYHYTFFGEWCGGNIQAGVGINGLEKQFVIFKAFDLTTEKYVDIDWQTVLINAFKLAEEFNANNPTAVNETLVGSWLNTNNVYLIDQVDPWYVDIDFSNPEFHTEQLENLTLGVEEECPWAKMFGKTGIGEGIVWEPQGEFADKTEWKFKVKGIKHQKSGKTKPTNLVHVDPVKVAAINDLIEQVLPEWRLEQGVTEVTAANNGVELTTKDTGAYLKWIMQDILKEESDVIAANAFDWNKDISPKVVQKARQFFLFKFK